MRISLSESSIRFGRAQKNNAGEFKMRWRIVASGEHKNGRAGLPI
jgi:hypothetical protein